MDCGVACLAMLLGLPYEDVYVAACKVDRRFARLGLAMHEMQSIAKLCGVRLARRRLYDIEADTGILSVRAAKYWHFVVLFRGVVVDPDAGRIFDADEYRAIHDARFCTLLMAA